MKLINRLKYLYDQYPRQYWLMITGIVLSTAGGSMIWPFLLIGLTSTLSLLLLNSLSATRTAWSGKLK